MPDHTQIVAPDSIVKSRKDKCAQAAKAGRGTVYDYGFEVIRQDKEEFFRNEWHKLKPVSQGFKPNPYLYQYDLEVHIFINYDSIVSRQIEALEKMMWNDQDNEQLNIKLDFVRTYGTGLTRSEHFWNAASIRWPTKVDPITKKEEGMLVREPWAEDFINAVCGYEYVNMFGGSGQGKTHRALAFMCIMWDHYIDSELGGRCCFSTVAEDKMKGSTWPYMNRIYNRSKKGISLYCGRGIKLGEYTITRPHDKKGGGSIKGILLPRRNDNSGVDKLTGSHGHPVGIYHIDELQNTPDAPVEASPNFLQNCGIGWITASGNYDQDDDALGKNVIPLHGWDTVDETTHLYEGRNALGIKCACIHYNNDLSPAFNGEGFAKWGHMLPTKKKKDKLYPSEISRRSNAYRRLWVGWRQKASSTETVLNKVTMKETGAMELSPNWDESFPVTHCMSFDSAPTSTDRNILVHFADGVDKDTGKWKIHFYEAIALKKIEDATKYCKIVSEQILTWARKWGVKSGNATMDWTNVSGVVEKLMEEGFQINWVVYNQSAPDGKTRDKRTQQIPRPILVDAVSGKFAHTEVANCISAGALLMQNFVFHGQISGLHESFINEQNSNKTFDEELCLRKFVVEPNLSHGERLRLDPKHSKTGKTGFTKTHGFSPDILDCLFQACLYAAMYRGMIPGYKDGDKASYKFSSKQQEKEVHVEELSLHEDDLIDIISDKIEYKDTYSIDYMCENEDLLEYV